MKPWPQRRAPAYGVTAADNTLRLLQLLRDFGEVRISEAAAELDVGPSTVHRLMSVLVFRGYAVQDEARTYLPGPAIGVDPVHLRGTRELYKLVKPHLTRLGSTLDESVYCMILSSDSIRFILSAGPGAPLHPGDRHGLVLPATESAGGIAILASLPAAELWRRFGPESHPTATKATFDHLTARLRPTRSRGYALSVANVEVGIATVAVALRNSHRYPPAAISTSCLAIHSDKLTQPNILGTLLHARDDIEAEIAATSTPLDRLSNLGLTRTKDI